MKLLVDSEGRPITDAQGRWLVTDNPSTCVCCGPPPVCDFFYVAHPCNPQGSCAGALPPNVYVPCDLPCSGPVGAPPVSPVGKLIQVLGACYLVSDDTVVTPPSGAVIVGGIICYDPPCEPPTCQPVEGYIQMRLCPCVGGSVTKQINAFVHCSVYFNAVNQFGPCLAATVPTVLPVGEVACAEPDLAFGFIPALPSGAHEVFALFEGGCCACAGNPNFSGPDPDPQYDNCVNCGRTFAPAGTGTWNGPGNLPPQGPGYENTPCCCDGKQTVHRLERLHREFRINIGGTLDGYDEDLWDGPVNLVCGDVYFTKRTHLIGLVENGDPVVVGGGLGLCCQPYSNYPEIGPSATMPGNVSTRYTIDCDRTVIDITMAEGNVTLKLQYTMRRISSGKEGCGDCGPPSPESAKPGGCSGCGAAANGLGGTL